MHWFSQKFFSECARKPNYEESKKTFSSLRFNYDVNVYWLFCDKIFIYSYLKVLGGHCSMRCGPGKTAKKSKLSILVL